ncbi:ABC transporter ATP-binding protein YadG [Candidatus Portiera aleyrodidarum]|uniref:ABC-type multidrug transport system, ATPase component n=1 Tax=Candidatus Portiera aleyrodidarum TV TaxID=1297582 RepID=A0A8D3XAR0_9GAMM|nr:ATP-binding cassette domain-containing protein [Candidatus Portiera aleyrodidarum]AGI27161.1 ABC-type multidrug transport system, ATPase component [Candidatus Portiera aleyrodidarum TV]CEI59139.1 ABC transporter ATP-binding protein YadG [Candidatus Portiera aleyrodidarum]
MKKLALSIKKLTKIYKKNIYALKDINLNVINGDFFALLGPNGAGKSTTIGIISSLIKKTCGKIKIFDIDIDKNFSKAKYYLGYVSQEYNFNQFEKVENILFTQAGYYGISKNLSKLRIYKLLKDLSLFKQREMIVRKLSGGMKRRLMIARSLVHNPKLLILDEPTAGLDIEVRKNIWDYMYNINKNEKKTIILTTHYLEEAESLCRNVAIINKGIIIKNTSMQSLLRQLDVNTFLLETKNPLKNLPLIKGVKIKKQDSYKILLSIKKGTKLNDIFNILEKNKIEILSIRNNSNRLEEMFLNLIDKKNRV